MQVRPPPVERSVSGGRGAVGIAAAGAAASGRAAVGAEADTDEIAESIAHAVGGLLD